MAVQLVSDLGLHLNLEQEQLRPNTPGVIDNVANIRRNLFWAVSSEDTYVTLCLFQALLASFPFDCPPKNGERDDAICAGANFETQLQPKTYLQTDTYPDCGAPIVDALP